jgi:hypothetical protein
MTTIDIKDNARKLTKLRERKVHLEKLIEITKDQICGVEQEMMRCGTDLPSSVVKCCGMCQPNCSVHYQTTGGCGCHHQCLKEQQDHLVVIGVDETSGDADIDFKLLSMVMESQKKKESPSEKMDRELDEPLNEFVPEKDWPRKL